MTLNIAVVGSGISGLVAAHGLSKHHNVDIYEKKAQLGLGSERLKLSLGGKPLHLDVPPRVINQAHYPKLFELLAQLGVDTYGIKQDPSFNDANQKSYFSLVSFHSWFSKTISLPKLNWRSIKWLSGHGVQLLRWQYLLNKQIYKTLDDDVCLYDYLIKHKFSDGFIHGFLFPIWSLMCSANQTELKQYPAKPMLKLLADFSGAATTLRLHGGTLSLEKKLIQNVNHIFLNEAVESISYAGVNDQAIKGQGQKNTKVLLQTSKGQKKYDHVIVATEPCVALSILSGDFDDEKALLKKVPTRKTTMQLHTDEGLMPTHKKDWAPVNMMLAENNEPWASIWMNAIEPSDTRSVLSNLKQNIFQSWDSIKAVQPSHLLSISTFYRTLLTPQSAAAMRQLSALQSTGSRQLWLAGAYLTDQVPLLEEGVVSAQAVIDRVASSVYVQSNEPREAKDQAA